MAHPSYAQDGKTEVLTALGSTTGLLLYNTYVGIGAIADGYGGEVYDSATVISLMDEQLGSLENVTGELTKLTDSGFLSDKADKDFILEVIATLDLLKQEAAALKVYSTSASQDDADLYEDARNAAWDKISAMLGLD